MAETKNGKNMKKRATTGKFYQIFIKNVLDVGLSMCEYSLAVHMGFRYHSLCRNVWQNMWPYTAAPAKGIMGLDAWPRI